MAKRKFSLLDEIYGRVVKTIEVTRKGEPRLKRGDLKKSLEEAFEMGAKAAAGGERVRFPVIGALVRKEVKARKAGKGVNPFTGEEIMVKARPATKKPRWSFPKKTKEIFGNKRFW
ncbi:MAG: HU family DNA-binding protein [Deltaproteobacteria bacterium]|nr:HU family DNA-binding protein [Deltaproteobacteria bacterium]